MTYEVTPAYGPVILNPTTEEEIIQNVGVLLATPQGSVPMDRAFGLSQRSVDRPVDIAKNLLVADITAAIERYEPRASIEKISFQTDGEGRLIPTVEVTIDE